MSSTPEFADHIRWLRRDRDWTQRELADRVGHCPRPVKWVASTVAKIELGTRVLTAYEATALAWVFGVTVDDVLCFTPRRQLCTFVLTEAQAEARLQLLARASIVKRRTTPLDPQETP